MSTGHDETARREKVTIRTLQRMKRTGESITCLTAYDALLARLLDRNGIDLILVGDSAGMVMAGRKDTDEGDDAIGVGFQLQQALGRHFQIQLEGFYAVQERRGNSSGARLELLIVH